MIMHFIKYTAHIWKILYLLPPTFWEEILELANLENVHLGFVIFKKFFYFQCIFIIKIFSNAFL